MTVIPFLDFLFFNSEGLVNRILSARFWIPLSRLTYCAYLVHIIVLQNLYARFESVWFYTDSYMVSSILPNFLLHFILIENLPQQ